MHSRHIHGSPRALVKASIRAVSTASSLWAAGAAAAPAGAAAVALAPALMLASWAVEAATAGGAVVAGAVFGDDLGEAPLSALPDFAPPEA